MALTIQECLHVSYLREVTHRVLLGVGVCMKDHSKEYVLYGKGTVVEHKEIW